MNKYEETKFGFRWGALEVERTASGPDLGTVVTVRADNGERVEVRVTPKGRKVTVLATGGVDLRPNSRTTEASDE